MPDIIAKAMPDKNNKYDYIALKPADNGFMVKYDEMIENPMETGEYNCDRYRYEDRVKVFQMDENTTMEQALDNAVALFKKLHMANLGMADTEG